MAAPQLTYEHYHFTEPKLRAVDSSPQEVAGMKAEIRLYLYVFASLIFLTGFTVLLWSMHLPKNLAIILAISLATFKGSLVVCFFMHLLSERLMIMLVLTITAFHLAGVLIGIPLTEVNTAQTTVENGGTYFGVSKENLPKSWKF